MSRLSRYGAGFMMNSCSNDANCRRVEISLNAYHRNVLKLPQDVLRNVKLSNESQMIYQPVICIKTTRDVEAGEELTWNYCVQRDGAGLDDA